MTDHHDHDTATNGSTNRLDDVTDLEGDDVPTGTDDAASPATVGVASGTLPLVGGGLLVLAAIRSRIENRTRAMLLGITGIGLIGLGFRKRRSSEAADVPEVEGGTEGKETSDEAASAANRIDSGRVSEIEPDGEIADEPEIGESRTAESDIEYTEEADEEPRQRPGIEAEETDPRRDTDAEVAVDVSNSAMADEESEATGPSSEQAQPTQTEGTEPEASPAEDASHMKVDPPTEDDSEPDRDDADGERDADDGDDQGNADDADDQGNADDGDDGGDTDEGEQ
ncbi:hypothetical protein [Natrinema halophilum]|uniref:Uncharacterized protein n=1 Tax=Natrinema halophilum TaxID=1699371 RepID=A0A7D5L3E7_9EURY|nr:hypothetical protein [Natrinema halophilum]QLG49385.1 hypothetical protein HYG82_11180 [Natrinema halophilum]